MLERSRSKLNTYTVYRENRGRDYVSHCNWTRHRDFVTDADERELTSAHHRRVTICRVVPVVRHRDDFFNTYVTAHRAVVRD